MKLKNYMRNLQPSEREDFAIRCGTTPGYIRMIQYGHKPCMETLALAIERESGGLVTVAELRPQFAADLKRSGYVRLSDCQIRDNAA